MKLWFGRQEEMAFDGRVPLSVRVCARAHVRTQMKANLSLNTMLQEFKACESFIKAFLEDPNSEVEELL